MTKHGNKNGKPVETARAVAGPDDASAVGILPQRLRRRRLWALRCPD